MKYWPLVFLLLAGCSKNDLIGKVFSPNPAAITCPTKEMLKKLQDLKSSGKDLKPMLLDGGGLCTALPAAASLVVAEVDCALIRVRPQRSPNARGVWTTREILK